jgi:hypothetical protein
MDVFIEANRNILILVSLGLVLISLAAILVLLREVRLMKRPFRSMADVYSKEGAESALTELLKGVDQNREFLRMHSEEIKRIFQLLEGCFSGTGIVKYNAFEDIGGNQSYSLCVMTGEKNGFILTNLVGRNATRGYAIEVREGKPSRDLSSEEREAFEYALRSIGE